MNSAREAPRPAPATACDYAAWILAGAAMLFVLTAHLLPALIAGLLICELVRSFAPLLAPRLAHGQARVFALALTLLLVIGAAAAALFGLIVFMRSEGGSPAALLGQMADVIESLRAHLPAWLAHDLPADTQGLAAGLGRWLREHAADLERIGRATGHNFAHILVGVVIGALVSLRDPLPAEAHGPLARALTERVARLALAFRRIVFAQIRISALNTVFTALYLAIALPLFGVDLPLTKTMIVAIFVAGLLPVIGNLISNTIIVIVSLAHSPAVAAASLAYLVVIHKLEYFLNARIVGGQIRASAWELLAAMLVLESVFGIAGVIAAPIAYAWLKDELQQRGLIAVA